MKFWVYTWVVTEVPVVITKFPFLGGPVVLDCFHVVVHDVMGPLWNVATSGHAVWSAHRQRYFGAGLGGGVSMVEARRLWRGRGV